MNMKRAICVLFALILMVGTVGCGRKDDNSSTPQGQDEISLGGAEAGNSMDETDRGEGETLGSGAEFGDENVLIDVQLSKEGYTLREAVEVKVTVTNIAETPIVYVQGSGSNLIPDALNITLDELSPLFQPFQTTMDYGVHTLDAGESVTFDAHFAPYRALGEDVVIGLDRTIDWFTGEAADSFEPVNHGEYQGHILFTYVLSETAEVDVAMDLLDNSEHITIEGDFHTAILEDDGENPGRYEDEDGFLDDEDSRGDGLLDELNNDLTDNELMDENSAQ